MIWSLCTCLCPLPALATFTPLLIPLHTAWQRMLKCDTRWEGMGTCDLGLWSQHPGLPVMPLFQTRGGIRNSWLTVIMLLRVLPYIFVNWHLMRFKSISLLETMFLIRVPSRVPAPWTRCSKHQSLLVFLVHLCDDGHICALGAGDFHGRQR